MQEQAKGAFLVTFEEVDSIEVAERLAGCCCLVRRADLPQDALVAPGRGSRASRCVMRAQARGPCGRDGGGAGQTLLSVERPDGRTSLVPFVDAFVVSVDEDARRIDVDVPDGLLDL